VVRSRRACLVRIRVEDGSGGDAAGSDDIQGIRGPAIQDIAESRAILDDGGGRRIRCIDAVDIVIL